MVRGNYKKKNKKPKEETNPNQSNSNQPQPQQSDGTPVPIPANVDEGVPGLGQGRGIFRARARSIHKVNGNIPAVGQQPQQQEPDDIPDENQANVDEDMFDLDFKTDLTFRPSNRNVKTVQRKESHSTNTRSQTVASSSAGSRHLLPQQSKGIKTNVMSGTQTQSQSSSQSPQLSPSQTSQQREPDDIPDDNQVNVDEDADEATGSGGWTKVERKQPHSSNTRSHRGASSSGNRSRESGQRGRERAGSSQSDYNQRQDNIGYGRSNRGRPQTPSYQSGRGNARHSQRGASSSSGSRHLLPQQTPWNPSEREFEELEAWDALQKFGDARIASVRIVSKQSKYINAINTESPGNYRSVTGFRFKKWMYASRTMNKIIEQHFITVSYGKYKYKKYPSDSWVKVSAIVYPELIEDENMEEDIINQQIYGCFLYVKPIYNYKSENQIYFRGNLRFTVNLNKIHEQGSNRGVFCGVYPYYESKKYNTCIIFTGDSNTTESQYYQSRFRSTKGEKELAKGISHFNTVSAIDQFRFLSQIYLLQDANCLPIQHLSAIYVPKYVSLTVFFTNKEVKVTERFERNLLHRDTGEFHERLLVQCGGVVVLNKYPLYFQYMDVRDSEAVGFKDIHTKVNDNRFGPLVQLMGSFTNRRFEYKTNYPLMVLGIPNDPVIGQQPQQQPHFAGYFLEIQNYKEPQRAILRIPSNANISEVHEMGSYWGIRQTNAAKFLDRQWNEKTYYKEFTGPWDDTLPNNDGSKWEAFYKSKNEYLAPNQ